MAERKGFEPLNGFIRYTISNRAPSTSSATSPDGAACGQRGNGVYYTSFFSEVKTFFTSFLVPAGGGLSYRSRPPRN